MGLALDALAAADPGGYPHQWQVHEGKPHWMDLADAVSIPFLQSHTRDPIPNKLVWRQQAFKKPRFYWLSTDTATALRKVRNLALAAMLEAVRDRTKTVDLKQVNRVLLQPHWRRERDLGQ